MNLINCPFRHPSYKTFMQEQNQRYNYEKTFTSKYLWVEALNEEIQLVVSERIWYEIWEKIDV